MQSIAYRVITTIVGRAGLSWSRRAQASVGGSAARRQGPRRRVRSHPWRVTGRSM